MIATWYPRDMYALLIIIELLVNTAHRTVWSTFPPMPPKRLARPSTPPSSRKKSKKAKTGQQSIDSFFSSPSKPKANGSPSKVKTNGQTRRDQSVISFHDSDDEGDGKQGIGGDEELARKLAFEWSRENDRAYKGKGRATPPLLGAGREGVGEDEGEDGGQVVELVDASYSDAPGVNGSSSSNHLHPPIKSERETTSSSQVSADKRPASPPLRSLDVKPTFPKPTTITSTNADPVAPIDFTVDAFLFRPDLIDCSTWPKGRLPYSVLVGVYVQASQTRSRLLIVRIITK